MARILRAPATRHQGVFLYSRIAELNDGVIHSRICRMGRGKKNGVFRISPSPLFSESRGVPVSPGTKNPHCVLIKWLCRVSVGQKIHAGSSSDGSSRPASHITGRPTTLTSGRTSIRIFPDVAASLCPAVAVEANAASLCFRAYLELRLRGTIFVLAARSTTWSSTVRAFSVPFILLGLRFVVPKAMRRPCGQLSRQRPFAPKTLRRPW